MDNIKLLLEDEFKVVGLEILHTLRTALKARLETNGKVSIDRALLCLLQKKTEEFSYSKDPVIKRTFNGCTFNQLQELVKVRKIPPLQVFYLSVGNKLFFSWPSF